MLERNIYYSQEWKEILIRSYKYRPFYLENRTREGVNAVLPLMFSSSTLMNRRALVSLPFSDDVGPYAAKKEDVEPLFEELLHIRKVNRINYQELRGVHEDYLPIAQRYGFGIPYENVRPLIGLNKPWDEVLNGFSKSLRRNLRQLHNLELKMADGMEEKVKSFYEIHLIAMKHLGTPPHAEAFFKNIAAICGENAVFFQMAYKGRTIAAMILLLDRKTGRCRDVFRVSDPRFDELNPQTAMLYEAVKFAHSGGFSEFDLGVSRPGSGVLDYKLRWTKDAPQKVWYLYFPMQNAVDPRRRKISLVSNMWRTLMPAFAAKIIGPMIRKELCK